MRAEGQTEQTADLTITCVTPAVGPAVPLGTANINLSLTPAVPITSKSLGTSSGVAYTEALAGQTVPGGLTFTSPTVQGSVTGTGTMTFAGVPTPLCAANTVCSFNITITNVRANVTSLGAGPVAIGEALTVYQGGFPATVNPVLIPATTVGISTNSLSSTTVTGAATGLNVCSAYGSSSTVASLMTLNFKELFTSAFKMQGVPGTVVNVLPLYTQNGNLGAWTAGQSNTESGFIPTTAFPTTGALNGNLANSATRIKVIFAGVPASMKIYVPLSIQSNAVATGQIPGYINLVTSENGAFAAAPPAGSGALATLGLLTTTGGTATAIYEVTAQAQGVSQIDSYSVPASFSASANSIAGPPVPTVSATVQYASGTAGNVPAFSVGSTTGPVNGPTIGLCATTMMFPFLTHGGGFDVGLAIANTTVDTLGTGGASSVTAQSGTCSFSFFGTNAPASPVVTPTINAGATYAATLSSLAPNFTGYAIATCNFLFGHSFAYITYNLTQTNGVSMGYLGLAMPLARTASAGAPEGGGLGF
jgi:hypothetical protein